MKFKFLAFILIAFSINLYADEYKFDYAVIGNKSNLSKIVYIMI